MRALAAVAAFSALATARAGAQPATFTSQPYPFLGNNHVAADFNSDGKPDLAGTGATSVGVMLNNGNGTFQPKVAFPVGGAPQDLDAGDFNGDGKLDLAVTINTPQIFLSLLTGNGNGTFNAPISFVNTFNADSPCIVATDLNNDGKLDAVISHEIACYSAPCGAATTITIMLGNGDATFQQLPELPVGTGMHRLAAGDFNRDGIRDLAICGDNTRLYILLGLGNGGFAQQPTILLVPGGDLFSASNDVDVADFNGDTFQDLVVALPGNGRGIAIVIGNGDGTFDPPFRILANALFFPQAQAVADYNHDGFQDIARAMGDGTGGLMEILHGNGNGTFQPPAGYVVPPPQSSIGGGVIISGDFNIDGRADIALSVVGASPALNVLLNSTEVGECPADVVNTGPSALQVDVTDLLALLGQWGPCPVPPAACPANIVTTGPGANSVDVSDLLALLGAWGPCP
jgi:hypothetical protein